VHLSSVSRYLPLYCINNRHDFKGWRENQSIMLRNKTWFFYLEAPVEKMVPVRLENAHIWVSVKGWAQRSATECLASFSDIHNATTDLKWAWFSRPSERTAAMLHQQAVPRLPVVSQYQKQPWDFDTLISPSITFSLFHSELKTYLFRKSYPPP